MHFIIGRLLTSSNQFLRTLAKQVPPFEVTIGMNGRVWVKAADCKQTLFLVDAITQYSNLTNENEIEKFIDGLLKNSTSS